MKENSRSGWSILAALISMLALVLVTACGDDDDDGSSGGSGGQAGTPYAGGGGTSGSPAGSGGTSGAGTGGEPMDAGQNDGAAQVIDAGGFSQENEACSINLVVAQASGVCLQPTAACEGGFAPLPGGCAQGLECCVDSDQCETIAASMSMTDSITCVATGSCSGTISLPGCPSGQECCVNLSFEGGLPNFDGGFPGTGGTPAVDGG